MDFVAREKETGIEHILEAPIDGVVRQLREAVSLLLGTEADDIKLARDGADLDSDAMPLRDTGLQGGDILEVSQCNARYIRLIRDYMANLDTLPTWARNDKEVVLAAIRRDPDQPATPYTAASAQVRSHPEVALEVVSDERSWPSIPACLWDSKPFLLEAVKKAPACYACASEAMRRDVDVAVEVCKSSHTLITLVHPSVRSRQGVILAALEAEQGGGGWDGGHLGLGSLGGLAPRRCGAVPPNIRHLHHIPRQHADPGSDESAMTPSSAASYGAAADRYDLQGLVLHHSAVMLHASAELRDNGWFMTKAAAIAPNSILHASARVRGDPDIMRAVVWGTPRLVHIAPKAVHQDDEFMRGVVAKYPPALPLAGEAVRSDAALLVSVLGTLHEGDASSIAVHCLPEVFSSRDVLIACAKCCAAVAIHALSHSPPPSRDMEVMLLMLRAHGSAVFPFVPEALKASYPFAKDVLQLRPGFFAHLHEDLREDPELALLALADVRQMGALPEKLSTDRAFALRAAEQGGLCVLSDELREDPEVLAVAIKHDVSSMADVPLKARSRWDLMICLVQCNKGVLDFIPDELRYDPLFIADLHKIDPALAVRASKKRRAPKAFRRSTIWGLG